MERTTSVWATESGGDCVQHAEAEIRRESELTRLQGTTKRAPVQDCAAQYRAAQLSRV
ncbi:MAG: hypothetical protein GF309_06220 [Candidatus Lokiarchaeota archaeon]|nr:hypothetical protein [Candidatus Lokiarchaeota archaeon]